MITKRRSQSQTRLWFRAQRNIFQRVIYDATPMIVRQNARSRSGMVLSATHYNRLLDIHFRATVHSLPHSLSQMPQLRVVDDLCIATRHSDGKALLIAILAKSGNDQIAATQVWQDLQLCQHAYPTLTPRLVAVQFTAADVIAMFELVFQGDELRKADERQYRLVGAGDISEGDLQTMAQTSD